MVTKVITRDPNPDNTAMFGNEKITYLIHFRYSLGVPYEYNNDDSLYYCGYVPGLISDRDEFEYCMRFLEQEYEEMERQRQEEEFWNNMYNELY